MRCPTWRLPTQGANDHPELSYSCLSRACSEKGGGLPRPSAADSPVFLLSSPDVFQLPERQGPPQGAAYKECPPTITRVPATRGKSPSRQVRRCGHSSLNQPTQPCPELTSSAPAVTLLVSLRREPSAGQCWQEHLSPQPPAGETCFTRLKAVCELLLPKGCLELGKISGLKSRATRLGL